MADGSVLAEEVSFALKLCHPPADPKQRSSFSRLPQLPIEGSEASKSPQRDGLRQDALVAAQHLKRY